MCLTLGKFVGANPFKSSRTKTAIRFTEIHGVYCKSEWRSTDGAFKFEQTCWQRMDTVRDLCRHTPK